MVNEEQLHEFNTNMMQEAMKNKLTRIEMQNNSKEYNSYYEIESVVLLQVQNLIQKLPKEKLPKNLTQKSYIVVHNYS